MRCTPCITYVAKLPSKCMYWLRIWEFSPLHTLSNIRPYQSLFDISVFNEKLEKWRKLRELIKEDMFFMLFGGISLVQFDRPWLSPCVSFLLERMESQAGQGQNLVRCSCPSIGEWALSMSQGRTFRIVSTDSQCLLKFIPLCITKDRTWGLL